MTLTPEEQAAMERLRNPKKDASLSLGDSLRMSLEVVADLTIVAGIALREHHTTESPDTIDDVISELARERGLSEAQDKAIQALQVRLEAANRLAACVDDAVRRGALNSRSLVADARLDFGEPFSSEEVAELITGRVQRPSPESDTITEDWWCKEFGGRHVSISEAFMLYLDAANQVLLHAESSERNSSVYTLHLPITTKTAVCQFCDAVGIERKT